MNGQAARQGIGADLKSIHALCKSLGHARDVTQFLSRRVGKVEPTACPFTHPRDRGLDKRSQRFLERRPVDGGLESLLLAGEQQLVFAQNLFGLLDFMEGELIFGLAPRRLRLPLLNQIGGLAGEQVEKAQLAFGRAMAGFAPLRRDHPDGRA